MCIVRRMSGNSDCADLAVPPLLVSAYNASVSEDGQQMFIPDMVTTLRLCK